METSETYSLWETDSRRVLPDGLMLYLEPFASNESFKKKKKKRGFFVRLKDVSISL